MTDYIKREDAVRRIAVLMAAEAESDGCEDQPMDNFIEYALEDLADIPSADVVEVIRCKDCKWFNRFGCAVEIVDFTDRPTENDYCSFGERKDNER